MVRTRRHAAISAGAILTLAAAAHAHIRVVDPEGACVAVDPNAPAFDHADAHVARSAVSALRAIDPDEPRVRLSVGAPRGVGGLDIQFDVSDDLAAIPGFAEAIERAALTWETRLADPIRVVIIVDKANSGDPFIAAAQSVRVAAPYADVLAGLASDAVGGPEQPLIDALPGEGVPVTTASGTQLADLITANSANLKAVGLVNSDNLPIDLDAYVIFNTDDFLFDLDPDDGVTPGAVDLLFVLVHEVGHVLGFTSQVDFTDTPSLAPSVLDLFRFSSVAPNDPEQVADYADVPREIRQGAEASLDTVGAIDFPAPPPPFSTGVTGDGRQASHWKDDVLLGVSPAIGVMDPTYSAPLGPGTGAVEGYLTDADLLAMRAIGWEIVQTTPCPADLSGDGFVGSADLARILGSWGDVDPAADLDGAPGVSPGDLAILLASWGACDS